MRIIRFLAALSPYLLFGLIYNSMRYCPNYLFGDIDTAGVYNLEKQLFGIISDGVLLTPNEFFHLHHWAVTDILSGMFYLCWVPLPVFYTIWLYATGQRRLSFQLSCGFLFVNLIGFCGYYIHPAAPPWYVMEYGFTPILAEYGGDHAQAEPVTPEMQQKYPYLGGQYDVTVSRAQEDMNIHMVIDAYRQVPERTVVIVSNWQKTDYGQKLYAENHGKYPNVILQNAIYDQKELNVVRSNATLYLHTHSMCGTAPSLVEAMYLGLPVICFKVPTNLETTEHKSIYFESVPELVEVLKSLDEKTVEQLKTDLHEIALRRYNWKRISDIYKECIDKCLAVRG